MNPENKQSKISGSTQVTTVSQHTSMFVVGPARRPAGRPAGRPDHEHSTTITTIRR
jgi:hypothetical protein